jgi:peptide/nickel transport system permease protein
MAAAETSFVVGQVAQGEAQAVSYAEIIWGGIRRDRFALAGALFLGIVLLLAIAAPLVSPYDPYQTNAVIRLSDPGTRAGHLLGTDEQGRDLIARLIYGGRISLAGGVLPVAISGLIGLLLGMIAGYSGRLVAGPIMRILEVFYASPGVLRAIAFASALGPGFINVTLSLIVVIIPPVARVAEAATLTVRNRDYVEAARASGAHDWQVILFHVLPNVAPTVLVYCTTLLGLVIVFASGLSFLGLGIQPPQAEWGSMLSGMKEYLFNHPVLVAVPGVMIFLTSLAFNLVGDGLRDALDPRLRR